jgi:hypothetical protein
MINGRYTQNSGHPQSLPEAAAKLIATSLPMTWQASMIIASHCVGLIMLGIIELPGSFAGSLRSPKPQRGPEASQRKSLAISLAR